MIKEGCFLKFIPPLLRGNDVGTKKRYMLVVENDTKNKIVKMINVSSTKGKEHRLLFDENVEINNYFPLPVPSFAKFDALYVIDYFKELENFIVFNNKTLGDIQFKYLNGYRMDYMKNGNKKVDIIQYTKQEFLNFNKE